MTKRGILALILAALFTVPVVAHGSHIPTEDLGPQSTSNVQAQTSDGRAASKADAPTLELGKAVSRAIGQGESHSYQLTANAGQFIYVSVDERAIALRTMLFGADNEKLLETDAAGSIQDRVSLFYIAASLGVYRVEVTPIDQTAGPGRYEIELEERRAAAPEDPKRIAAQALFIEGSKLYAQATPESYRAAVARLVEAQSKYHELGMKVEEGVTLNALGRASWLLKENEKVVAYYQRALDIKREEKDRAGEARVLLNLGNFYDGMRQYEKDIEYCEQALAISREIADRTGEGRALNNLGKAYSSLGQYRKAIAYLEQGLIVSRQVKDRGAVRPELNNLGNAHRSLGQYEQAVEYYSQLVEVSREAKDRASEGGARNSLGDAEKSLGRFEMARLSYLQALPIKRELKDKAGEAATLNSLGSVYQFFGQYDKAIQYYEAALALLHALKTRADEGRVLNNLANCYDLQRQHYKAIGYYQEALAISTETNDGVGEARALTGLGRAHNSLSLHDKAIGYYLGALDILHRVKDPRLEGAVVATLSATYYDLSQYDKAIAYNEQALLIYREVGDSEGEGTALARLGNAYNALSQYNDATSYYEQALAIFGDLQQGALAGMAFASMNQYQKTVGDLEEALMKSRQAQSVTTNDWPKLTMQLGHWDGVMSAAFSPDGRYILTGSWDSTARLWEMDTGREVRKFEPHGGLITDAAFSPDGRYVLTASWDDTVRLWEAQTGRELRRFPGNPLPAPFCTGTFSPNGKYVLTAGSDKGALLWEVETGKRVRRFEGHADNITSSAFSRDGRYVLTGSLDHTARLWEVETGKQVRSFEGHSDKINSVAFSPDGRHVLTASDDKTARLWETETGREVRRIEGHSKSVKSAAFSPDGRHVLTGSEDKTARLWESETGIEVRRFEGHSEGVTSAAFSSDGRYVLTGSYEPTARLWEAETGTEVRQFAGNSLQVWSVAFSPDGEYVLAGGSGKGASLWNLETGRKVRTFQGRLGTGNSVAFSPDGGYVLTGSYDKTARLWETATGREVHRFEGHSSDVTSVAFSPNGRYVLTGSKDKTARLWEVETGREARRFEGHSDVIQSVAFSPDGRYVLTGSGQPRGSDNTARLWESETGREIRRFEGHSALVYSVAFSPNGRYVATASGDGTVRLWESETGREAQRIAVHFNGFHSVAFSADGRYVLTGGEDNTARLWEAETGRQVRRFDGHSGWVQSVAFSPDGRYVLTAGTDSTTRLWEAATGKPICSLISFKDGTWAVFDSEGRFDASNGGEVDGLYWVVGNESIDLYQLKSRYYAPGLFSQVMGVSKERPRDVSAFRDVKLYPHVEMKTSSTAPGKADVVLTERGGGIGRVEVYVNDKRMEADARGPSADKNAKEASFQIDLNQFKRFLLPGEDNRIEVVAYNAEDYLASRGVRMVYKPPKEATVEPHFWALVAGVSDYRSGGDLRSLNYAAKDAEGMAKALGVASERLFPGRTSITLLATSLDKPDRKPTKHNITAALREIADKAQAGDVFVVYLAGHGVSYGGQDGDYYFLTSDASTGDLKDTAIREATALSSDELANLVIKIPALKQVMILDTCASGRLIEKLTASRSVDSSTVRAWDRMKDRAGLWILAGSAADASSYESSRYGQGVLTYSLLQGMKQDWEKALRKDDKSNYPEFVDVSQLFQYSSDEVPLLAEGIGGIQRPLIANKRDARSFDFGRITVTDRASIPLASEKPVFLRTSFSLEGRPRDPLELTRLVDERLRDASTRGLDSPLVFWDVQEHPGAFRVAGLYQTTGSTVTVKLYVSEFVQQKDRVEKANLDEKGKVEDTDQLEKKGKTVEQDLGEPVTLRGDTSSPAGLDKLVSEILSAAERVIAARKQ
jgi:WD40 repeat protein/tetratricopeptide (TPR) repeat protein